MTHAITAIFAGFILMLSIAGPGIADTVSRHDDIDAQAALAAFNQGDYEPLCGFIIH